ncbi:crosslink repair DNA glycosylase YcaQ family protein [Leucobacter sp. NPDC077196]|uniref:DNA glycosylase AlkZ-like family protein n=1 Tax=Leucobacter sp. NPDC077196 TaxID=3154959 RepID=UPI00341F1AA6
MSEFLSLEDVLRLRMFALGLSDTSWPRTLEASTCAQRIAGVAHRMLALQGQDWRSARWALGSRAPGATVADVEAAFAERRIVRSWPMRGTVHVVAAEDIGWMQQAANHRVLAGAPKRRAFLGMSDAALERLVDTSLLALDESGPAGLGGFKGWSQHRLN